MQCVYMSLLLIEAFLISVVLMVVGEDGGWGVGVGRDVVTDFERYVTGVQTLMYFMTCAHRIRRRQGFQSGMRPWSSCCRQIQPTTTCL